MPKTLPVFFGQRAPFLDAKPRLLGNTSGQVLGSSGQGWLPSILGNSWALTNGSGKALELFGWLLDAQGTFWKAQKWLWEGPGRSSGEPRAPGVPETVYIHEMAQLCNRMQKNSSLLLLRCVFKGPTHQVCNRATFEISGSKIRLPHQPGGLDRHCQNSTI